MTSKLRLLGVVLCGGKSSRMGTDKANLKHRSGVTFLQHSCQRLANLCDEVVVSGNRSDSNYSVIVDVVADRGPAAGVASALEYAHTKKFDACYVTPVDMPDLSIEELDSLKRHWLSHPQQMVCGVSEAGGKLQPLVGIYPTALFDEIEKLARSEHRSLFRWIESQPHETITLSNESCRNVNTPEDL